MSAFGRAFLVTLAVGAPLLFAAGQSDAAPVKSDPPPCQLQVSPINQARTAVTYTGGAWCPEASVVFWTMRVNRGGVLWASRSGQITEMPTVFRGCRRGRGVAVSWRVVLTATAWYRGGIRRSRTLRGAVTSGRCS